VLVVGSIGFGDAKRASLPALASSVNITGITNANPGVVTTGTPHGFLTGDNIFITDVMGMTAVNMLRQGLNSVTPYWVATVLTPTTFEINRDTTADGAYVSGGKTYPASFLSFR